MRNILIIGTGPAGLTAALYAARANLHPLVIEGHEPGGQLTMTTTVENFPGFPDGVEGPDLMDAIRRQAMRFGAEFLTGIVERVDLADLHRKRAWLQDGTELQARSLIISTGASARLLGIPRERELLGRGVSTCATCDGFFFTGRPIAVVGGGDSVMEEATYLTRFASEVTVIHRRQEFRASRIMAERARANPKIRWVLDSVVDELLGDERLTGLKVRNLKTGVITELAVDACFVAIGHQPNTEFLRGHVELDATGYIVTRDGTQTSVAGVFACGDVQDHRYRQAITAAGTGCMAAQDAQRWLEGHRKEE